MDSQEIIKSLLVHLTLIGTGLVLVWGSYLNLVATKTIKLRYRFKDQYFLIFVYLVAMIATLGSLFYSEVAGYEPCKLCWYQRILMYPQAILYMVALAKNDMKVGVYGVALSVVGGAIALYHYLQQIGVITASVCGLVGFSVSCSQRFSTSYGYITIPMMALIAFLLIILAWWAYWLQLRNRVSK